MTFRSHYNNSRDDDDIIPSLSGTTASRITSSRRRRSSNRFLFVTFLLLAILSSNLLVVNASKEETDDNENTNSIELDENSVVLITGAAGFLGSELAMALERTYNIKKVIGIDSMDSGFGLASIQSIGKTTTTDKDHTHKAEGHNKESSSDHSRTEEELAIFEFRRQRVFHLLQTLGSKGHFYRADFRPSIPEYFDMGEIPILDYIVREHPDITHVVHLADPYSTTTSSSSSQDGGKGEMLTQAVPRIKDQTKSGMMEALLEQLRKIKSEASTMPHFTFASSYEVYDHHGQSSLKKDKKEDDDNIPPFREHLPITTPSSLHGASKILDEILAQAYGNLHNIHSVGLRFFSVYGPWGQPSSSLFEMAERSVTESTLPILSDDEITAVDDVRDYVYIDDAIDALMAAMQYRPPSTAAKAAPKSVVINVGTGVGTTLKDVAHIMEDYLPRSEDDVKVEETIKKYQKEGITEEATAAASKPSTESYASIQRAKDVLGYEPQIDLKEGLLQTLAWHYDRTFPYGGPKEQQQQEPEEVQNGDEEEPKDNSSPSYNTVALNGITSCSPFDKECLKGMPVFPCASECSHEAQCTTSWYDDVLVATQMLTHECSTVMYTVALDSQLNGIPSANEAVALKSSSHIQEADEYSACNIAFVHENSPLVRRLKHEHNFPSHLTTMETFLKSVVDGQSDGDGDQGTTMEKSKRLKHGFWTLVPVIVPSFSVGDENILQLLPKLSPGLFFGGRKTTHAIYCDPNVIFLSVSSVLVEAKMQPYLEGRVGGTALLIGKKRTQDANSNGGGSFFGSGVDSDPLKAESIQNAAYRTIRIGAIDEVLGDGIAPLVDSHWLVHMLKVEDSRLFRCDVLGETIQWNVSVDVPGFEFIMALHDMWSRVVVRWNGIEPWWIGDGVITIPQGEEAVAQEEKSRRRRLEEEEEEIGDSTDNNNDQNEDVDRDGGEDEHGDDETEKDLEHEDGDVDHKGGEEENGIDDTERDPKQQDDGVDPNGGEDEHNDDETEKDLKQQDDDVKVKRGKEGGKSGNLVNLADAKDDGGMQGGGKVSLDSNDGDSGKGHTNDEDDEDEDGGAEEVGFGARVEGEAPGGGTDGESPEDEEDLVEPEKKKGDAEDANVRPPDDDEVGEPEDEKPGDKQGDKRPLRDRSSYDTWMGVLSSTDHHYFVRIIPSTEVGVMFLDDYA